MARSFAAWTGSLLLCVGIHQSSAMKVRYSGRNDMAESSSSATTVHSPVVMFSHGCSCTTAGIHIVDELLQAHGLAVMNNTNKELMKVLDERHTVEDLGAALHFRDDEQLRRIAAAEGVDERLDVVYRMATAAGEMMTFKTELGLLRDNPLATRRLKDIRAKLFLYLRTNLIDVLACRVTDFCHELENKDLGTLVDKDSEPVDCEFRGRGDDEQKEDEKKVLFYGEHVLQNLQMQAQRDELHARFLVEQGFQSESFTAEELLVFEYDPHLLEQCAFKWAQLLRSVGVEPKLHAIVEVLSSLGTFPAPKRHSEMIENFEEVKALLKGTEFFSMLRM